VTRILSILALVVAAAAALSYLIQTYGPSVH
jgi:hypothetical protein